MIDLRENRTNLLCHLFKEGFNLRVEKLECGDYLVSPEVAVERKALGDLISSLSTGRLLEQVRRMKSHFEVMVLLIELKH